MTWPFGRDTHAPQFAFDICFLCVLVGPGANGDFPNGLNHTLSD